MTSLLAAYVVAGLLVARLGVAVVLLGGLSLAARARPPRRSTPPGELRALVVGALGLDAAGIVAWGDGRGLLASGALTGGIASAALAAWLSRARRGDEPGDDGPGGDGPRTGEPPPSDDSGPIDWERFDRARAGWERRDAPRPPVRSR